MQALPIILSVAGTAMSFIGQRKQASALDAAAGQQEAAAEQAERIGQMNAARQEAETQEAVRREKLASEEAQSMRKARAAASGGELSGSTSVFLEEQAGREADYISWLEKAGASQAEIERQRGRLAGMEGRAGASSTRGRADQSRWGSIGTLVGGASDLYNIYNPAGL